MSRIGKLLCPNDTIDSALFGIAARGEPILVLYHQELKGLLVRIRRGISRTFDAASVCPRGSKKVIGKEKTDVLDPPGYKDQLVPWRCDLATDITERSAIVRYGLLESNMDSKACRDRREEMLFMAIIEPALVSMIPPTGMYSVSGWVSGICDRRND